MYLSTSTSTVLDPNPGLYRVQIEDNTLQIGSFVACTYDEKWWLGMVAQVSDEFGDHNMILDPLSSLNMLCIYQDLENNSICLQKLTLVGH